MGIVLYAKNAECRLGRDMVMIRRRLTSSTLRVGHLNSAVNFGQGLGDTVIGADEVARLEGCGTSAAEDTGPGVATDDGNLLQALLLT